MSIFFTHIKDPYKCGKQGYHQENLTQRDFNRFFKTAQLGILSVSPGYIKSNGEVYTKDGIFIPFARELPMKNRINFTQKSKKIHGKVISLIHERRNYSYYHWMFETLPKLALISHIEPAYYYLHYGLKYQRESLKALGIPEKKIINANRVQSISADDIIIPSAVCERFNPADGEIQWLKKKLLRKREAPKKNILVNRRDGLGRRIINEDEVVKYLSDRNFKVYNKLSSLNITEQASLFHSSTTVIGAHGAALSNIIFCKEGALIIEIFGSRVLPIYKKISHLCNLRYRCIRVAMEDLLDESDRPNFRLNIKLLQKALQ